ncbi:hypothetical protein SESBI_25311 [Sesbania bispinosa]|nr:hypothetical protein SESBI_25311 [Sesbania bispinosa]
MALANFVNSLGGHRARVGDSCEDDQDCCGLQSVAVFSSTGSRSNNGKAGKDMQGNGIEIVGGNGNEVDNEENEKEESSDESVADVHFDYSEEERVLGIDDGFDNCQVGEAEVALNSKIELMRKECEAENVNDGGGQNQNSHMYNTQEKKVS